MAYFGKDYRLKMIFGYILTMVLFIYPTTILAQDVLGEQALIHTFDSSTPGELKVFMSVVQEKLISPNEERIMAISSIQLDDKDAFDVSIDGNKIERYDFQRFETSPEGIDVVLAIDISGSVYRNFDYVTNAINRYIDNLRRDRDRIALITFGSDIQVAEFNIPGMSVPVAFTDDVGQLKAFIERKPARERMQTTILFQSLYKAIQLVVQGSGKKAAERGIILLSDGHDEGAGFTIEDCIRLAKENQVPVFSLGVPEEGVANKYHGNLEKIALSTGGIFVPINDMKRLDAVYQKLDELVKQQYILNITVPPKFANGKEYNLKVAAMHNGQIVEAPEVKVSSKPPPEGAKVAKIENSQKKEIENLIKDLGLEESADQIVKEKLGLSLKIDELTQAQGDDLISKLEAEVDRPPIWKKWWFWSIVGAIAIGLAALLIVSFIRTRSAIKTDEDTTTTSQQQNTP